jgi:hypothetical protein
MGLGFDIGQILGQYNGVNPQQPPQEIEDHFDQVASNAPHEYLGEGVSEAFRSDQTPPFANMLGQSFGQADNHQRTGMVNQLLGGLGPAVISSMLSRGKGGGGMGGLGGLLGGGGMGGGGGGMGGGLAAILGQLASGGRQPQLTQDEVSRLRPEEIEELAQHAERENPGVIDQMGRFFAQNPNLVKGLGGAALAIALGKMAQRR